MTASVTLEMSVDDPSAPYRSLQSATISHIHGGELALVLLRQLKLKLAIAVARGVQLKLDVFGLHRLSRITVAAMP